MDQSNIGLWAAVEFTDEGDYRNRVGVVHVLSGGYLKGGGERVYGTIGRIEGTGGVLWQNPYTNPDGSPREIPAVDQTTK